MKLTLTEALRIKNEISSIVRTLNYKINSCAYGVTTEDGKITSRNDDSFIDVENALIKALNISEEINDKISDFNKVSGVDSIVRKLQNHKLLLKTYEGNLQKTKPTNHSKFENLGTVRQNIEVKYEPLISSNDMKVRINAEKSKIREKLQHI